jgi:hypothetical protein
MAREQVAAQLAAQLAVTPVLAGERTLPVTAGLSSLFTEGGLRRGSTVVIRPDRLPGATGLALALLSGPSTAGSWCAVVGAPDLGLVAAAQLGVDLSRLALVPEPGAHWPAITAALLEGVDLVLLCLSTAGAITPSATHARKLEARARERGSVLLVLGEDWPGTADARLRLGPSRWGGLGDGHGYLARRQLEVVAGGRGAASRSRQAVLRLQGHRGTGLPGTSTGP